ncbi:MAG: HAD-superfamily hydrolase, subfamily variant 1 [Firmicutes bacterium]|nr:HAD-superfamily hydrolase, subfamily variant 1 [Bacillota bacterium]
MRYKGILFDLDGTLLDTNDLIIKSFQHTIAVHYKREVDIDVVRSFYGKTARAALEFLGPDKVEEMTETFREYQNIHHDQLAKIFTEVAEVIQELYNAGVKLGIVTSKRHDTAMRGLKLFDMDKYFSVVIGADQCQNTKPHPEPVQLALAKLGLKPQDCLMVGDSPFDIVSGGLAGVKTVAVRWSEVPWPDVLAAEPDYIINTMSELISLSLQTDLCV